MCINPGPCTVAHGNQNEDHRRLVYESGKSARKRRSLVSADSAAATTASEDLKAQTRNCRRGLSFVCYDTSESACALRGSMGDADADADVFRTITEHGITNMTLRVKHGTLEDQGLILGRLYHNKIVASMAGKGGRLYDTGACHLS